MGRGAPSPAYIRRSQEFILGGALLRPERPKFEAEGRERGRDFGGGGSEPTLHQLRDLGERCKLSQPDPGQSPGKICILNALIRVQKRVFWRQMPCQSRTLGATAIASSAPWLRLYAPQPTIGVWGSVVSSPRGGPGLSPGRKLVFTARCTKAR